MDNKLTKAANDRVEELKQKINDIVNADRIREPKLTDEEKQRVIELEKTVKKYKPLFEGYSKIYDREEADYKKLNREAIDLILSGESTLEEVTGKLMLMRELLPLAMDTARAANNYANIAAVEIENIKRDAREREIQNER